jgi:hypothetical protein
MRHRLPVVIQTRTATTGRRCGLCRAPVRPHPIASGFLVGTKSPVCDLCVGATGLGRELWRRRWDAPVSDEELAAARRHAIEHPRVSSLNTEDVARLLRQPATDQD